MTNCKLFTFCCRWLLCRAQSLKIEIKSLILFKNIPFLQDFNYLNLKNSLL